MDIKHLEYFITIVENRCNISKAAEVLYISQPALTKYIKEFEESENVNLFIRYKGLLIDLSPIGKSFYEDAKLVVSDYHNLMKKLHVPAGNVRGTVRIGIPPIIVTSLCRSIFPKFIAEHPNIELKIYEAGAAELQRKLLLQEIDLAFLITPITMPNISHTDVHSNQIVAIFNKDHWLAKVDGPITYKMLENAKLAIFDETFLLHNQIIKNFHLSGVSPNIFFTAAQWDLLIAICEAMDTVALLPRPILELYKDKNLEYRTFDPEFPWTVTLAKLNNVYQNDLVKDTERYFIESISAIK